MQCPIPPRFEDHCSCQAQLNTQLICSNLLGQNMSSELDCFLLLCSFHMSISKKMQEINGYHINLLSRIRNLLQKTSSMIHDCRMLLNLEPALSQANFDPLDASHPDDHDV